MSLQKSENEEREEKEWICVKKGGRESERKREEEEKSWGPKIRT